MKLNARKLFESQSRKLPCSFPGCYAAGQAHTSPALCDRHEIICRIVGQRSRPAWGGNFRFILIEDVNHALKRIRPDAAGVFQDELEYFIQLYAEARNEPK